MSKRIVRLTESDLHQIISESVNQILNEIGDTRAGQYMLGRLAARQNANRRTEDLGDDTAQYAANQARNGGMPMAQSNKGYGNQSNAFNRGASVQKRYQDATQSGSQEQINKATRRLNKANAAKNRDFNYE